MDKKLIKLFDSEKAEQLSNSGFKYMIEDIGEQKAYVFCVSQELLGYLQANFSQNDFVIENTLRF